MNKRGGIASPSFTSPVTSPPTSPRGDAGGDGGVELTVVKGGRLYSNFVYLNPLDAKALTLPTKPAGLPHNTYLLINLHLYLFKYAPIIFLFIYHFTYLFIYLVIY
jgi:hypothetical protein